MTLRLGMIALGCSLAFCPGNAGAMDIPTTVVRLNEALTLCAKGMHTTPPASEAAKIDAACDSADALDLALAEAGFCHDTGFSDGKRHNRWIPCSALPTERKPTGKVGVDY